MFSAGLVPFFVVLKYFESDMFDLNHAFCKIMGYYSKLPVSNVLHWKPCTGRCHFLSHLSFASELVSDLRKARNKNRTVGCGSDRSLNIVPYIQLRVFFSLSNHPPLQKKKKKKKKKFNSS